MYLFNKATKILKHNIQQQILVSKRTESKIDLMIFISNTGESI